MPYHISGFSHDLPQGRKDGTVQAIDYIIDVPYIVAYAAAHILDALNVGYVNAGTFCFFFDSSSRVSSAACVVCDKPL